MWRFEMSGLQWPLSADIDEGALERALFKRGGFAPILSRPIPDWTLLNQELKRKGVTLYLLWREYLEREPANAFYQRLDRALHDFQFGDDVRALAAPHYDKNERKGGGNIPAIQE